MPDNILKRRAKSGFVNYPKSFEKRIIDGTARFRTKCDMLIGPCACGGVHQENDDFVRELLAYHSAVIEPLNLTVSEDGRVLLPRYWYKPRGHERCTVLSGRCDCGQTHTANEQWVVELLATHNAKILDCPETALPMMPTASNTPAACEDCSDEFDNDCDCAACREERARRQRRHRERNSPRRNEI